MAESFKPWGVATARGQINYGDRVEILMEENAGYMVVKKARDKIHPTYDRDSEHFDWTEMVEEDDIT